MTAVDAPGSDIWAAVILLGPMVAPLAVAVVAAIRGWSRALAWGTTGAAAVILTAGVSAAVRTTRGSPLELGSGSAALRADSLSAVMVLVIGLVAVIATWAGRYAIAEELDGELTDDSGARRYAVLVPLFLAAMVLAVLAANLGVLWAAIAATTVITAFLVGHRRTSTALEAAWKYVVICSVGVAMAYLGTILMYFAGRRAGLDGHAALDWTQLSAHAGSLDQGVVRLAFALLVIGFGTKAGLVPLHSWLPDAHSQAPGPVSALMSGVLLSVGVYAILRYRIVVDAVVSPVFVRTLLVSVALASLALAAVLLVAQRDYKRMLAYSSIEHMALCVIGVAVGTPLAIAAVLLHVIGHGLGKSVLFCSAGTLQSFTGTSRIADVRGLLGQRRVLAVAFGLGLAALVGLPPFSMFASEVGLIRAMVAAGLGWVGAVVVALLLLAFVAMTALTIPMLLGEPDRPDRAVPDHDGRTARSNSPLIVGLAALAVIGVTSWPLGSLLSSAAEIASTR